MIPAWVAVLAVLFAVVGVCLMLLNAAKRYDQRAEKNAQKLLEEWARITREAGGNGGH